MAYEIPGDSIGVEVAAVDLTTSQFKAVEMTSYGWDLASAGEQAVGILQNDPDADQAANVMTTGVSKAMAGAAFSKGDLLKVGTGSKFILATTGTHVVAQALEAAGANLELVAVAIGYKGLAA